MTLRDWIEKTGNKETARLLSVDASTVSTWKIYRGLPTGKMMFKIHKATKGQVTYTGIIDPFFKATGQK